MYCTRFASFTCTSDLRIHLWNAFTPLLAGVIFAAVGGCGNNPPGGGNVVAQQAVAVQAENAAVDHEAGIVPDTPDVPDVVVENPDIEVVSKADDRPAAKTGLVQGLAQMLNSTPLDDEQKTSIRDQMDEADNILHQVKQQNNAAMRRAFRQPRIQRVGSPNIVVIVADDLCLNDLKCYGSSEILTPNIDRLAQFGTRFTQAYAASPDSREARWTLVAGRGPSQAVAKNQHAAALQSEETTVAEVMWQAGYTTAVFGHWGVLASTGPAEPQGHGYDEWLGTYGLPDEPQPYPEFVNQSGNKLRLTKNAEGRQGQFAQDFFVSEAAEFVTRHAGRKPMFLQFFFSVPGPRRTVPKLDDYADKSWPDSVKIRAAAITRMDRDIGKLLQRLRDVNQLSNTVFILTSDTAGIPTPETHSAGSSSPVLRGTHGDLHEGGLRVPLIICGPGDIPVGTTSEVVTAAWDLGPTVYQLATVAKVPPRQQGQSLLPHLKPNAPLPERFLNWEPLDRASGVAIRWKNWKGIRPSGSSQWELYDLKADPSESHNIAAGNPEVIGEILTRLTPQPATKSAAK